MSDGMLASLGSSARPHGTPAHALAPGVMYWQARERDRIVVRLVFAPENRIQVDVWWNRSEGRPDVQCVFGLYGGSVEFGSLTGNGFDAPQFHRIGLGTFVVNVAVQALKATCKRSTIVEGVLSNTAEAVLPEQERARLEANRRAFWRRFGLDVQTRGDPPLDYLTGHVGSLRIVPTGLVGGQFPRCVSLRDFASERPAQS